MALLFISRSNTPSTDEHADGLRGGLDDGGGTHEECAQRDRGTAPEAVRDVWGEGICSQAADVLNGVQQTELREAVSGAAREECCGRISTMPGVGLLNAERHCSSDWRPSGGVRLEHDTD